MKSKNDKVEADTIAILGDLEVDDILTLRETAKQFRRRGVPCPFDGGDWTASNVLRAIIARCHGIIARTQHAIAVAATTAGNRYPARQVCRAFVFGRLKWIGGENVVGRSAARDSSLVVAAINTVALTVRNTEDRSTAPIDAGKPPIAGVLEP